MALRRERESVGWRMPNPCGYNASMNEATSESLSVGVRELKDRLSAHLDRVKRGEELTVTERGRPIARLAPVGPDVDRMAVLVEAGVVRPAAGRRVLPGRRVEVGGDRPLSDEIAAQRR